MSPVRRRHLAVPVLVLALAGCAGLGEPAPAASPGSLARAPLTASEPTSTSVGPADTGPAGSAAAVGDGTAAFGGRGR
jgi:hypothetical protein